MAASRIRDGTARVNKKSQTAFACVRLHRAQLTDVPADESPKKHSAPDQIEIFP